jgi:hypothetical protein
MTRLTFTSAAISAALALSLIGNQGAQAQTYLGAGGYPCGKFVASARADDAPSIGVSHWLLGYVSGLNMAWKSVHGTDRLINTESDKVPMYVLRYCLANPDRTVLNGVNDYFFSLPK